MAKSKKRTIRICKNCRANFDIPNWRLKQKGRGTYCSQKCSIEHKVGENAANWRGATVEKLCPVCKKVFSSFKRQKRIYCSKACWYKSDDFKYKVVNNFKNVFHPSGKDHHQYKKSAHPNCKDCDKPISYGATWCSSCSKRNRSPELIKRILRRRKMSSLEIRVNDVIKKYDLPYKFVGNGEVMIGRKNPDFVNINGLKVAVEVYARKHKEQFRGNVNEWRKDREKAFSEYGWRIIYIEDWQTNKEEDIYNLLSVGGKYY